MRAFESPSALWKINVPGSRIDLQFLEHTLVIRDVDDGSGLPKSWELIHPAECPRGCHWWPGAPEAMLDELLTQRVDVCCTPVSPHHFGEHLCYLQYETECNGIDSLAIDLTQTSWLDDVDVRDEYEIKWNTKEWARLRAGSYIVQGWYTPGGWAGDYYDPDGGINLIDRLPRQPKLVLVA